jgi:thiosulfate/3-mercaptopyruvate sulfurtransferase
VVHAVQNSWLRYWAGAPEITVIDPRSRTRYLSGHIPHAIWVPVSAAFGPDGRLLSDEALAKWLGESGVSNEGTVVVYGDSDGQAAAMLAWILSYLGHPDVAILRTRLEHWRNDGGELAYRPEVANSENFTPRPQPELRANWDDASKQAAPKLLDARSPEEYRGDKVVAEDSPGHIPGAINIPWLSFVGENEELLCQPAEVLARLRKAGANPDQDSVVYCRAAQRSSVAWLAMRLAGSPARLYDGGILDWSQRAGASMDKGSSTTKKSTGVRSSRGPSARKKSVRRASS